MTLNGQHKYMGLGKRVRLERPSNKLEAMTFDYRLRLTNSMPDNRPGLLRAARPIDGILAANNLSRFDAKALTSDLVAAEKSFRLKGVRKKRPGVIIVEPSVDVLLPSVSGYVSLSSILQNALLLISTFTDFHVVIPSSILRQREVCPDKAAETMAALSGLFRKERARLSFVLEVGETSMDSLSRIIASSHEIGLKPSLLFAEIKPLHEVFRAYFFIGRRCFDGVVFDPSKTESGDGQTTFAELLTRKRPTEGFEEFDCEILTRASISDVLRKDATIKSPAVPPERRMADVLLAYDLQAVTEGRIDLDCVIRPDMATATSMYRAIRIASTESGKTIGQMGYYADLARNKARRYTKLLFPEHD